MLSWGIVKCFNTRQSWLTSETKSFSLWQYRQEHRGGAFQNNSKAILKVNLMFRIIVLKTSFFHNRCLCVGVATIFRRFCSCRYAFFPSMLKSMPLAVSNRFLSSVIICIYTWEHTNKQRGILVQAQNSAPNSLNTKLTDLLFRDNISQVTEFVLCWILNDKIFDNCTRSRSQFYRLALAEIGWWDFTIIIFVS